MSDQLPPLPGDDDDLGIVLHPPSGPPTTGPDPAVPAVPAAPAPPAPVAPAPAPPIAPPPPPPPATPDPPPPGDRPAADPRWAPPPPPEARLVERAPATYPPPAPPVDAPPGSAGKKRAWVRHPATWAVALIAVVALAATAVVVLTGDDASATPVTLEPAGDNGTDPFMDSIATDAVDPDGIEPGGVTQISTNPGQPVAAVTGDTPGLYGGTGNDTVCDPTALVDFLDNHPDKAQAFATVQGIAPDAIADFVATLTPVLLREDTRVTNHGFTNGTANPLQSVLQAGTAVLVDQRGVPRVRCACGNPLTEPTGTPTTNLTFTGTTWNGFDDTRLITVAPSPQPLDTLTITDITTGQTQDIPTGTNATTDEVVLRQDGVGVAPFGTPADDAIAALTEALGPPDSEGGTGCASGSDATVQLLSWGGFSVEIGSESGLYLWRLSTQESFGTGPATPPGLATPEGLGVDATLSQFESTYDVTEVLPDSLGNPISHHFAGERFRASATDSGELLELWAASAPLSDDPAYGVAPSVCVWFPD